MPHNKLHAINAVLDHLLFGDCILKNVGVGAGDVAAGNHTHTTIFEIGTIIPPHTFPGYAAGFVKVDTVDYYSVPRTDDNATLFASFYVPVAGTYSLRLLHTTDNAGGGNVNLALSAGQTAAAALYATRQTNILNAHAWVLAHAAEDIIYQTSHDLGAIVAGNYVAVLIAKTADDGAGNFNVLGIVLVRTA